MRRLRLLIPGCVLALALTGCLQTTPVEQGGGRPEPVRTSATGAPWTASTANSCAYVQGEARKQCHDARRVQSVASNQLSDPDLCDAVRIAPQDTRALQEIRLRGLNCRQVMNLITPAAGGDAGALVNRSLNMLQRSIGRH